MDRRTELTTILGSEGYFYSDGKRVWGKFLKEAFQFSNELQSSVRTKPVEHCE